MYLLPFCPYVPFLKVIREIVEWSAGAAVEDGTEGSVGEAE